MSASCCPSRRVARPALLESVRTVSPYSLDARFLWLLNSAMLQCNIEYLVATAVKPIRCCRQGWPVATDCL
jgi:hypothetical protein